MCPLFIKDSYLEDFGLGSLAFGTKASENSVSDICKRYLMK